MSFLGAQNSIALGVQGLIHIDTGVVGSADYLLAKSLRFRSSASAYLNRTLTTPTNNKIWTWSGWVKRGKLGAEQNLFGGGSSAASYSYLDFQSTDIIRLWSLVSSSTQIDCSTTAVFRDPAAWYHVVLVVDTTQATNSSGVKLWVNGVQQTLTFSTYVQNSNTYLNSAALHSIAALNYTASIADYFDGEMAEVNFVDGQALAPTAFGATGANSQWLPKAYTGTYGTNGFYLPFTNTTSTSTLVADSSGNANNWSPNNISLTAGSTYDSLTDVPTLTSATVANYAVLNPLDYSSSGTITLTNGNLTASGSGAVYGFYRATIQMSTKTYWEQVNTMTSAGDGIYAGIALSTGTVSLTGVCHYSGSGSIYLNGSVSATGASYTTGDVIGMAYDPATGNLTFYKNNASQATIVTGFGSSAFPICGDASSNTETCNVNFGQQPFVYTAPTGFLALNTYNIPAGTVTTSGTFTGNLSTDGPFVFLNGTPTAMTINGNAVTFGTQADKLANGFKVRSSSILYNLIGSNTYVATTVGAVFKYEDAQSNP
jgi:hypothetical protein